MGRECVLSNVARADGLGASVGQALLGKQTLSLIKITELIIEFALEIEKPPISEIYTLGNTYPKSMF